MDVKLSYSTSEVARFCHVTADTIRKWAEAGRIQVFKTPGGHRRIRREELLRFLHENNIPIHADLTGGGAKILVIDSEKAVGGLIRRFLERSRRPFQVELAADSFEAGYLVATFRPDIIFLDMRVAGVDGFEVCRRIKNSPGHAATRIIALADINDSIHIERALDAGASACLRKPFTPDDMRRVFARVGVEVS